MWDVFYNTLRLKNHIHPVIIRWKSSYIDLFSTSSPVFTNSYLQQMHFHFFSFMTLYLKVLFKMQTLLVLENWNNINLKTKVFHLVLSCPLAITLPSFYVWFFKKRIQEKKAKNSVCLWDIFAYFCQCFIGNIAFYRLYFSENHLYWML